MSSRVVPEDLHRQPYFDDPFPVWEQLRHDQPLFMTPSMTAGC